MGDPTYWEMFLPTLLDRLSFHMHKDIDERVRKYGLNSHHVQYLMALRIHDGQTLVGLSKFLDIDNANTHRVIKFLKENGYVYDDRKDSKSKKYHVFLTERGKEVADEISDSIAELNREYFSELTKGEAIAVQKATTIAVGKVLQPSDEATDNRTPYFVRMVDTVGDGNNRG